MLTLSLVVYAVHVPLLIGFTVARYDPLGARIDPRAGMRE